MDGEGKHTDSSLLRSHGFHAGQDVVRKADALQAAIEDMSADKVTLRLLDGTTASVSAASFLQGDWRTAKNKPDAVELQGWTQFLPPSNLDFLFAQWRAELLRRITETEGQHPAAEESLGIYLKPQKDVVVRKKHAPGQLVIAPLSCKFDIRPEQETPSNSSAICVGVLDLLGKNYRAWILPFHSAPSKAEVDASHRPLFVHPFWTMKTSSDEKEANLEIAPKGHAQRRIKIDGAWKMPVAKNKTVLNDGDQLVLFRPVPPKPEPEALVPQPSAKKPRSA